VSADIPEWHRREILERAQQFEPTAYDRAQAELERKLDAAFASLKRKSDRIERLEERLDAALRRIEQLELDVARLKGPQRWEEPPCPFLPCGCPSGSNTHRPDCHALHVKLYTEAMTGQEAQEKARAYNAMVERSKLYSTAYERAHSGDAKPLPDEGV